MKRRDPLEPAATAVYVAAVLIALVVVAVGLGTVLGPGLGGSEACVGARAGQVPVHEPTPTLVPDVHEGVRYHVSAVELCDETPDGGQRALAALGSLPTLLVLVVSIGLALRLLRVARRHGVFTATVAARLRTLGWIVLAGSLLASLVETAARHRLVATMVDAELNTWFSTWTPPSWSTLFLGVALISAARLMVLSTAMRRDLDLTV